MIIGGNHTKYLAAALRGLEAQRQAAEHNIANIETPGFRARRVSFESSLRAARHPVAQPPLRPPPHLDRGLR